MELGDLADVANAAAAWVSLGIGSTALYQNYRRDRREALSQDLARLRVETRFVEPDEAILVTVRYAPAETHTRYSARIRPIRPHGARLALPVVVPKEPKDARVPGLDLVIRTAGERYGWPEGDAGRREIVQPLTQWRREWIEQMFALKVGPGARRATVEIAILDQATNRVMVRRRFEAMA